MEHKKTESLYLKSKLFVPNGLGIFNEASISFANGSPSPSRSPIAIKR